MSLSVSIKAFQRAVGAKRLAYDACSELLQRDDLPVEERERIDEFQHWIAGRSIQQFDEDRSNRCSHEVKAKATPFLATYGVDLRFNF